MGTAIKGGVEGLQVSPVKDQEKIIESMVKIIVDLVCEGKFNTTNINQLAKPIRLGKCMEILFKLLSRTGLINFMWDKQLKANDAYNKRFDCPYSFSTHILDPDGNRIEITE